MRDEKFRMIPNYNVLGRAQILAEVQNYNHKMLNIPEMWKETKGKDIKVVILDTGKPNHVDLMPQGSKSFIAGYSEDKNGHGCVAPDTLIHTNFCGIETIEALYERTDAPEQRWKSPDGSESIVKDVRNRGIKTYALDEDTGKTVIASVEFFHKTPINSEIIHVELEGGISYHLTPWHETCILKHRHHDIYDVERKRADTLQSGDRMIFASGDCAGNLVEEYYRVYGSSYRKCTFCGHIPTYFKLRHGKCQCKKCGKNSWVGGTHSYFMTEDMAYLVGLVLTDGHVIATKNHNRVEITSTTDEILEAALQALQRLGFKGYIDGPKKKRARLLINSKNFTNIMLNVGVLAAEKTYKQNLPEFVGKSPFSVICAFIAGVIDGDGCISPENTKNRVTTASKEFAYQFAALLNSIGVSCGIQNYGRSNNFGQEKGSGAYIYNCTFTSLPVSVVSMLHHPTRAERAKKNPKFHRKARRIKRVSKEQYYGNFFDFTVGGYSTYLANGHFVSNTHCGGILAAIANNNLGVAGIAPECEDFYGAVLDASGSGTISAIIKGIYWAVEDIEADIISMSLGLPAGLENDPEFEDACNYATKNGVAVIAAAGNEAGQVCQPARYDSVIAVAAVNSAKQHAYFSNHGPEVDFAVGGVNVYSTYLNNGYAKLSGTCVSEGSSIYTNEGPKAIEYINPGDVVFAFKGGKLVQRPVIANWYRGDTDTIRVSAAGRYAWLTPKHKVMTIDSKTRDLSWEKVEDLDQQHRLLLPREMPTRINPYLDMVLPADFCWLLGFFLADGWLSLTGGNKNGGKGMRVSFAEGDKEDIVKKYRTIYEKYVGKSLKLNKGGGWLYDDSTKTAAIIDTLGLNNKAPQKTFPLWLYNLPVEKQLMFYDGYLKGDGHLCVPNSYPAAWSHEFECASSSLIARLAAFADYRGWGHGIPRSRIRESKAPGMRERRPMKSYCLSISPRSRWGGWSCLRTSTGKNNITKHIRGEETARAIGIDTDNYSCASWKRTEETRKSKVYDLCVPDADCFVTQGIITHNSMATPALAGVASLILSKHKAEGKLLFPQELRAHIKRISFDVGDEGFDELYGHGIPIFGKSESPVSTPPKDDKDKKDKGCKYLQRGIEVLARDTAALVEKIKHENYN